MTGEGFFFKCYCFIIVKTSIKLAIFFILARLQINKVFPIRFITSKTLNIVKAKFHKIKLIQRHNNLALVDF